MSESRWRVLRIRKGRTGKTREWLVLDESLDPQWTRSPANRFTRGEAAALRLALVAGALATERVEFEFHCEEEP